MVFTGGSLYNFVGISSNFITKSVIEEETDMRWGRSDFAIMCCLIGKDANDLDIYKTPDGVVFAVEQTDVSPTDDGSIHLQEPYMGKSV